MYAEHTNTFITSSGAPEKLSITTPYTLAPKAPYDLHVTSSMWFRLNIPANVLKTAPTVCLQLLVVVTAA